MSTEPDNDHERQPRHENDDKPTRDARGRWLPGHCPNPRGRPRNKPKERVNRSDLHIFSNTYIDVLTNGQREEMLRREALLEKMYETAMKGRVSMQRFLYEEFHKYDVRLAESRVRYERLLFDWIIDNPRYGDPDFEIPLEVQLEIEGLRSVLEFYHPGQYCVDQGRATNGNKDNDEDDGDD